MKVCGQKIKELRELRAWSQEQLATASGLSVRTVQRAENDGSASRESRVCLAAALGVDHTELATHSSSNQPLPQNNFYMAKVTAQAFLASGLLMVSMLLVLGGGPSSPVFWIGWSLTICGAAFGLVAIVLKNRVTAQEKDQLNAHKT